ncbi:MAG TPA: L-threonylcarbamoyladenylate synthase [Candidatus Paceibacterota bacterium]|nr:L-threonylcarbamoyladenylate synthase [Candidatus Paceibacterota bacterium]
MNIRKINHFIAPMLQNGAIGVLPTDTLYGIVGSALDRTAVLRIYRVRRRNPKKPMIILVGSVRDLGLFGIRPDAFMKKILKKSWPGPISVIAPLPARSRFAYLHRGTKTLAFRMPKAAWLRSLLAKAGPLVAPSANLEGKPPAKTLSEAKRYFGDRVDFYVDAGRRDAPPSTLIALRDGAVTVLRQGAAKARF